MRVFRPDPAQFLLDLPETPQHDVRRNDDTVGIPLRHCDCETALAAAEIHLHGFSFGEFQKVLQKRVFTGQNKNIFQAFRIFIHN